MVRYSGGASWVGDEWVMGEWGPLAESPLSAVAVGSQSRARAGARARASRGCGWLRAIFLALGGHDGLWEVEGA